MKKDRTVFLSKKSSFTLNRCFVCLLLVFLSFFRTLVNAILHLLKTNRSKKKVIHPSFISLLCRRTIPGFIRLQRQLSFIGLFMSSTHNTRFYCTIMKDFLHDVSYTYVIVGFVNDDFTKRTVIRL